MFPVVFVPDVFKVKGMSVFFVSKQARGKRLPCACGFPELIPK